MKDQGATSLQPALPHSATAKEPESGGLPWLLPVLLALGSVVSYVDRAVLAVIAPRIRAELGLTASDYGLALNVFLTVYTVFYIAGGRIADRVGYRVTAIAAVLWLSGASAMHALIETRMQLVMLRGLLGIGEGAFFPAAMRAITETFEPVHRSRAVAILLCGSSIGMVLTPPLAAALTAAAGWRGTFAITGIAGLLIVPVWIAYWRFGTKRVQRMLITGVGPREEMRIAGFLRQRGVLCLLVGRAVTDAVWFFYVFWLPSYFQEQRGLSLSAIGQVLWIPYLCADAGALGGGWLSGGLILRGWGVERSRRVVMTGAAALFVCGTLAGWLTWRGERTFRPRSRKRCPWRRSARFTGFRERRVQPPVRLRS
jgi:ACS family hexuronate transporter-like MFS transporter